MALQKELGQSHRAIKTVMGWTGASERSVKNWIFWGKWSVRGLPGGSHLAFGQGLEMCFAYNGPPTGNRHSQAP